jgi:hypothetical protein
VVLWFVCITKSTTEGSMEKKKKHVFELTQETGPRRSKPASVVEMHRLLVRLLAPINETLRQKAMYRGDLSGMVTQALESVDLNALSLVALKWGQEEYKGVTIQIPTKTHRKLVAASKRRGVSMNTLINTSLVHWLAEQGDVKIRDKG